MLAFSSSEVAALRISLAALVLFPWFLKNFTAQYKAKMKGLFLTGLFGSFMPAFLFTYSETYISSALAGMLNVLTPVFTVILAALWLKYKVSRRQVMGLGLGLAAAFALMLLESSKDTFQNLQFGLLVVLATIFYAVSVNVIRKYLLDLKPLGTTAWAFALMGPFALSYLFVFSDFVPHLQQHPEALSSLGYTAILAIVGSALSVIAYNYLINTAGPVFASSCTYLIPVVALFWGLLDGEHVNFSQILCVLMLMAGVYLLNKD